MDEYFLVHHLFSCHHAFVISTAQTFSQICFAKIQGLISQVPVPLHVVSWEPQVVSILPLAATEQCAGKFLTGLYLLTTGIVSNTYAFTLSFIFSHFSVVCGGGGGQMTQQTISQ